MKKTNELFYVKQSLINTALVGYYKDLYLYRNYSKATTHLVKIANMIVSNSALREQYDSYKLRTLTESFQAISILLENSWTLNRQEVYNIQKELLDIKTNYFMEIMNILEVEKDTINNIEENIQQWKMLEDLNKYTLTEKDIENLVIDTIDEQLKK